ncbi:Sec63 Brl domain-containing protein [Phascolomyces articulosus]|uniref:DNA 3'-5' helicase n=1 Tax=Phascolomyces articulosus TaxID=60185 RepID=A0AAD5P7D1_9FUNG|nr:Sec63 Brl domain-containing protein [Phascolomyces articulosus]
MWDGLENQTSQHRLTAPPVYMDDTPEDFMMIEHDENSRISRWLDEEDALLDNPMLMTTTATIEQEDSSFLNSPINNENNGGYVTGGKNSIYGRKALQNINANTAQQQDIQLQKQASAIAKTQVLPMLQHRDIPSGAGTFIEPTHNNINLRSVDEIPMIYRSIFKFKTFNLMQSACMDIALYTQSNFVVSAPTGAGKTGVLELAILRALMDGKGGSKIIYMAPTKSLCSERANDWEKKFQSLGISCKEFTGDTDHTSLDAIKKSDIIVTTPEKWDSMTRRWVDYKDLMKFITLFIMDEVHILNERRGAVLEACVSRMKTMEHAVRYVAVSATVPNLQDIAEWLGGAALSFSEDFRPVQLERVVYGIPFYGDSMFSFESKMDWKLFDMIQKHSKGKPVLIFCSTRKSAQSSCEVLLKLMDKKNIQSLGTSNMTIDITNVKDKKLTEFLQKGIGFHHAGLESSDRQLVEQLFTQRKIRIVSTTSTLALGVNLPAHLVIIKSTKTYQNGALVDYSDIELLQMIGRAGRPGLEDSGCAVILTTPDMEQRYRTIMCGSSQIESCLHGNLVEHMMTEICLGTVTDIETCIKWLQSTFLYIRIKKNPSRYMIDQDATYSPQTLTPSHVLHGICKKNINMLTESELAINSETNHGIKALKATAYGIAMDRYCIRLETMVTILKSENCVSIKDVLSLVSLAKEFEAMRFTVGEKPFLNSLQNNVNIRFPIQGKVATISDKIFLVIQCVLGDISLHTNIMGSSLVFSSFQILLFASRIAKCIIDCCIYNQDVICLKHTLDLYRSIQAKMWASSPYPLRQIDKIGPKMAKTLAKAGISTFDQLRSVDAARIEVVLHRNPPFGNQIKEALGIIPLFIMDVQYSMSPKQPTEVILKISVSVSNTKKIPRKRYGKGFYAQVWIEADKTFIDFRRTSIQNLQERQRFFTVRAKLPNPSTNITCHVQSEDYSKVYSI